MMQEHACCFKNIAATPPPPKKKCYWILCIKQSFVRFAWPFFVNMDLDFIIVSHRMETVV